MISAKKELIINLKDIISYPITSMYPDTDIIPICIIQELANNSYFESDNCNIMNVVYGFELYDRDLDRLIEEFNKLDNYNINLGFRRTLYFLLLRMIVSSGIFLVKG